MAKFVKDVLYPGTYRLADGRSVTYTSDDVAAMARRLNDWRREQLFVPSSWSHQDGAPKPSKAECLARREMGVLGYADEARVNADGALEVVLDVADPEDAKRVPKVRFVSPEIVSNWVDGDGRVWPGKSITHIAFTSRPVQHRQNAPRPVQMSLDVVRLSLGDYEMAEENDKGTGGDDTPAGGDLKGLIEALKGAGLNIPDEVEDIAGLIIAVKASGGEPDADNLDAADNVSTDTTTEADAPVLMSLQREVAALKARLVKTTQSDLARRINGLTARGVPKPVRDRMLAEVRAERLSLDAQGEPQGKVLAQIEAYEALPAQLSHDDTQTVEVPDPRDEDGEMRKLARERAARINGRHLPKETK